MTDDARIGIIKRIIAEGTNAYPDILAKALEEGIVFKGEPKLAEKARLLVGYFQLSTQIRRAVDYHSEMSRSLMELGMDMTKATKDGMDKLDQKTVSNFKERFRRLMITKPLVID